MNEESIEDLQRSNAVKRVLDYVNSFQKELENNLSKFKINVANFDGSINSKKEFQNLIDLLDRSSKPFLNQLNELTIEQKKTPGSANDERRTASDAYLNSKANLTTLRLHNYLNDILGIGVQVKIEEDIKKGAAVLAWYSRKLCETDNLRNLENTFFVSMMCKIDKNLYIVAIEANYTFIYEFIYNNGYFLKNIYNVGFHEISALFSSNDSEYDIILGTVTGEIFIYKVVNTNVICRRADTKSIKKIIFIRKDEFGNIIITTEKGLEYMLKFNETEISVKILHSLQLPEDDAIVEGSQTKEGVLFLTLNGSLYLKQNIEKQISAFKLRYSLSFTNKFKQIHFKDKDDMNCVENCQDAEVFDVFSSPPTRNKVNKQREVKHWNNFVASKINQNCDQSVLIFLIKKTGLIIATEDGEAKVLFHKALLTVSCLDFSSTQTFKLITANSNGKILLWDLEKSLYEPIMHYQHRSAVVDVKFSSDDCRVIILDKENKIVFLPVTLFEEF